MLATIPEGAQTVRVMIPSDKVSFVIGTKGAVIHDNQRNSGAIVQVERGDSKDPNSLLRGVNISGSAEQIEAAKAEINRVIGTTAGVHEFHDDDFAKEPQNPYMSGPGGMGSLFNTALDLESMQKYMEMQMMSQQGMNPYYGMYPGAPQQPPAGTAMPPPPTHPAAQPPVPGEEEDAPPGFDSRVCNKQNTSFAQAIPHRTNPF